MSKIEPTNEASAMQKDVSAIAEQEGGTTKVEQLIQQHCPQGVEYFALNDIFEMRNGYTPSKSNKEFWEEGTIPWFRMEDIRQSGKILTDSIQHITPKAVKGKGLFKANSIILATTATIGEHAMLIVDSLANQRFTNLKVRKSLAHKANMRFYNYYMDIVDNWCKSHVNVSSFASVDMEQLKKLSIPLPPLPVQEEIVRILDTFTEQQAELQKELEAELQARQKQYQYYRNKLFAFDDRTDIKYKKLGEVFDTTTDFTAAGSFADIAKNVVYKREIDYALLVRTTDIKSNFSKEDKVYISQSAFEYLWRVNLNKASIILPNIGANCGEVHFITPETLPQEHCALGPNALLLRTSTCHNRFYYHYFNTNAFQKELRKIISPGGQTKFNKTELRKIEIPIPSLEEQERIVAILDRFDSLVNDLSKGLPAEIEARRKQYEYYRDKLLTFKRR